MKLKNEIIIKFVSINDPNLAVVIHDAIGNPTPRKVLEVIKSYNSEGHRIIGSYINDMLVGVVGIFESSLEITIRHISVLENFRQQGIGSLLLNNLRKQYKSYRIIAETDEDAVGFYSKFGFVCAKLKGSHNNLRYKCEVGN